MQEFEACGRRQQLAAEPLVEDRFDVAVTGDHHAVAGVFERASVDLQLRRCLFGFGRRLHIEYLHAHRLHAAAEDEPDPIALARYDLRRQDVAVGVADDHRPRIGRQRQRRLGDVVPLGRHGVVDHEGVSCRARIHACGHPAHRVFERGGQQVGRHELVVPRIFVGLRDRRAGQDVVHLAAEDEFPRRIDLLERVAGDSRGVGTGRDLFGGFGQQFVLAVHPLHEDLRGRASGAVLDEQQVARVDRKFSFQGRREVFEHLLRRGEADVDLTVGVADRSDCVFHVVGTRRAAPVADAVVAVVEVKAVSGDVGVDARDPRRVAVEPLGDASSVFRRVERRHDAFAVGALPEAYVERDAGGRAPREFLRGESFDARMGQYARHRGDEAEAVGQHVVDAAVAEFPLVVGVAVEDFADHRLGRGDVHLALLDAGASGDPPPLAHVAEHLGVEVGVVLLHHAVAACPREGEDVVGVLLEQVEVAFERAFEEDVDRLGIVPVPLRVQMHVTHGVERAPPVEVGLVAIFPRLCERKRMRKQKKRCQKDNSFHIRLKMIGLPISRRVRARPSCRR